MSWAQRIAAATVTAANDAAHRSVAGGIMRSGGEAIILANGRGGREWRALRYGMILPVSGGSPKLVWSAQQERMQIVEMWARLVRQRFIVPVDAYAVRDDAESWMTGGTAWMVGLYDTKPGRGCVTVNEAHGGGRRPVLLSQEDALAWLDASDWNAASVLAGAGRVAFSAAPADQASILSRMARQTAGERRAA